MTTNLRLLLSAIFAVLLLVSACSSSTQVARQDGDDPEPTQESIERTPDDDGAPPAAAPDGDESEPDDPGRAEPPGTQPAPRDVPPLVLAADAPGSDEAYEQMIDELSRFITPDQQAAGVPWPDSRNPDPVAAYQSSATFQNWMSENNVTPSLVEAYTAPNSPERGWDLDLFGLYSARGVLSTPSEPPYSMRVDDLVHPAATGITDALLAQVPDGSAAIVYWDSAGRSQLVRPDGTIVSDDPGWTNVGPWVAIMAPTDVGWQVWFDELTDMPPPGDNDDRGLPQAGPERQDV